MREKILKLAGVWAGLLLLLAAEFGLSFLHIPRLPIMLVPLGMAALVAFGFMRLNSDTLLAKAFAVMAVFWMIVLLGLGTMDPATRALYRPGGYQQVK